MANDWLGKKAMRVMRLPPNKFNVFSMKNQNELHATIKELQALAAGAALRASYLSERFGYGNGDRGHTNAVREANQVHRRVRRNLGYETTPKIDF